MEKSDGASNDIWDLLLDKLLNIGDDFKVNDLETQSSTSSASEESAHAQGEINAEKGGRKGHVRHNSDVVRLIEKDDIWSKGSARLALQKQNSWGKRPSLETVSENGLEELENIDIRKRSTQNSLFDATTCCLVMSTFRFL
jgi:hypothetical protein